MSFNLSPPNHNALKYETGPIAPKDFRMVTAQSESQYVIKNFFLKMALKKIVENSILNLFDRDFLHNVEEVQGYKIKLKHLLYARPFSRKKIGNFGKILIF